MRILECAGVDIAGWLTGFRNVHESVISGTAMIRRHPLVPRHVPVHGLVIDPTSGALEVVVDGNNAIAAGTVLDSAASAASTPGFSHARRGLPRTFSDVTSASFGLSERGEA